MKGARKGRIGGADHRLQEELGRGSAPHMTEEERKDGISKFKESSLPKEKPTFGKESAKIKQYPNHK